MKLEVGMYIRTNYGKIEKLKSIVTHEQIEQISYKVGE